MGTCRAGGREGQAGACSGRPFQMGARAQHIQLMIFATGRALESHHMSFGTCTAYPTQSGAAKKVSGPSLQFPGESFFPDGLWG